MSVLSRSGARHGRHEPLDRLLLRRHEIWVICPQIGVAEHHVDEGQILRPEPNVRLTQRGEASVGHRVQLSRELLRCVSLLRDPTRTVPIAPPATAESERHDVV